MGKIFSTAKRPVHLGSLPFEKVPSVGTAQGLETLVEPDALSFHPPSDTSILTAMAEYMGMLDAVRVGRMNPVAECPTDPTERSNHLKAFGYFNDASFVGVCAFDPQSDRLAKPFRNPQIDRLAKRLQTEQTKTLAAGIDVIMADLKASMDIRGTDLSQHRYALVILYAHPRTPGDREPGTDWIRDAMAQRSALRANECASVLTNYLRALGYSAVGHSQTTSEVALHRLAVKSGACILDPSEGVGDDGGEGEGEGHGQAASRAICPLMPQGFGLAVVTTDFQLAPDMPKTPRAQSWPQPPKPAFANRDFMLGEHAFETLKRVDRPTTYIDEPNVARVPKRSDMFARSLFGDLGEKVQKAATNGRYVNRAPTSAAQRRALGAFVLIQNGDAAAVRHPATGDAAQNAAMVKAAAYWLGADAVGISRCPNWAYYSHDARGVAINPYHDQAISIVVDQGFDTMEGASGDDWISCAQSMRAYLRFSLIGGVLAQHIRALGHSARAHSVLDGEVLQPPLLLLSGLGEVSRIGEVILNPFLGPRLKSGVVTTNLPMTHDKPIDFGLQRFCESCNKCARECPSGAITAGPKLMFNGYEIWKSDSQRCTNYRLTVPGGAMCGRCMKTCPWNVEGLMVEGPFRWMAMNVPQAARWISKLDDALNRGAINPIKHWWWELEQNEKTKRYEPSVVPENRRQLQKDLALDYKDQTLAVYPADLTPPPWPYPYPMDREAAIQAYREMLTPVAYRAARAARAARLAAGDKALDSSTAGLHARPRHEDAPVLPVVIQDVTALCDDVMLYTFVDPNGGPLPPWQAGAHLDVVVAPEFLRQYSMCGDPADRSCYKIAVLREDKGRGGSLLMHRIFSASRLVYLSKPINHFPVAASSAKSGKSAKHWLFGGGIGVTPMVAMAHELFAAGQDFHLFYSAPTQDRAAFRAILERVAWRDSVSVHISDLGQRLKLAGTLAGLAPDDHVYCCGPDAYMNAVVTTAQSLGLAEANCHVEYFAAPEQPDYENHPFVLELPDGRQLPVPADQSAAHVLNANGFAIDIKCSDGICGVCKCAHDNADIEHRDFVLSCDQRQTHFISCQSRAAAPNSIVKVDPGR